MAKRTTSRRTRKPSEHPAASGASVSPKPSTDSQNLIHYLLNHIGDEVMLIDPRARIVFVNDAVVRGLGVAREKLLGKAVSDFLHPRLSVKTWRRKVFLPIKKTRGPITLRVNRKGGDGHIQIIDMNAVYMPYKNEQYILSVARDRTQELALKDRLEESEGLFRLISEGAGDGIFACDLNGNLTYVNPALENLVGVQSAQLKGQRFIDYISKDSFSRALECFHQAKAGARNLRAEIELVSRQKERIPVEINVVPLYKSGEIVSIHAVVRDIRNRRHLEMVVRQSEKMQAMQAFVAGMAKEIRSPLFAVMSLTERLTQRYKNRDFEYIGFSEFTDMMRALGEIHARAKYSYETTERLIGLNKKKSGLAKERSSLHDAILSGLRLRQGPLRLSNIHLKLCLTKGGIPPVKIGRIELGQILENIFNNAIQAMPGGGDLLVRTRYQRAQGLVQVEIQDTGVGISEEVLPHIFEPFFTTKQEGVGKSTGLGLSIVAELLKAVQGDISVQSNQRQGTAVLISLPVVREKNGR